MNKQQTYQHWALDTDNEGILWLGFDKANASVNTLDLAVFAEFEQILNQIKADVNLKGLVIYSKKPSGFIAGADIEQFLHLATEAETLALIQRGQQIFNQLEMLTIPTVAMIKGFCLGGGLELSLACKYRVAEESAKTRLGLPEVKLGIQPGWGGSVRLMRLIGLPAMDIMLTGKTVDGRTAAKLGIIDVAVPERHLRRAATFYIKESPLPHNPGILNLITNQPLVRALLAKWIWKKVEKKARPEHYPAPFAMIDNWQRVGVEGQAAFDAEAQAITRLFYTATAKNLIRVFFLQEQMKGLAKGVQFQSKHVHVVGAGTMGGDIAAWCAFSGFTVTLQDREPQYIAPAIKRAAKFLEKKLKRPRLIQEVLDRLMPDVEGLGIAKADIIIEAIYENLQAKQELFQKVEAQAKPEAILATNTSTIPLDEISRVLKNPSRLVGIHFFNPVSQMLLVEVVSNDKTDSEIAQQAIAFVRQIDKLPLPVKSSPGFLINRILLPYLMESIVMLEEGIVAVDIDRAAVEFGMPMGPIELADTVGLDICLAAGQELVAHLGGTVPAKLETMVANKELGKKSGKGFYTYNKKGVALKEQKGGVHPLQADITDRLILRMLNEAVATLREQVVTDSNLLDAGMIFATGFAPFRGGPVQYAKDSGISNLVKRMEQLQVQYGERFKPDAGWNSLE